jgi:hypothetical protein
VWGRGVFTTAEHPLWVWGRGWVPAGSLRPGDLLRSADGQRVAVEAVSDLGEESVVYNLRVSRYHTYFVGDRDWPCSVWAHNAYQYQGQGKLRRAPKTQKGAYATFDQPPPGSSERREMDRYRRQRRSYREQADYGAANTATENLGKAGAKYAVEQYNRKYGTKYELVYEGPKERDGFDLVFRDANTGHILVIEAKGGNGAYRGRKVPGYSRMAQQGSVMYLKGVAEIMQYKGNDGGLQNHQQWGAAIENARKQGKVIYASIRTPVSAKDKIVFHQFQL